MTKKKTCTIQKVMDIATDTIVQYRTDNFAIITNWRNPYTVGIHGDWRSQVRHSLSDSDCHTILESKLSNYAPFILVYTKLLFNKDEILDLVDFDDATICVICSSGEHLLTPWMILHNIGHTAVSWQLHIKSEIMSIIGLTSHDDTIIPIQQQLVNSQASRKMMIPNLNELIYELFTTWMWWGHTRSDHKQLREYCDSTFPKLMAYYKNKIFWHRYRHPIAPLAIPQPWLNELLSNLDDEINYVPGVPGFTTKVLKASTS